MAIKGKKPSLSAQLETKENELAATRKKLEDAAEENRSLLKEKEAMKQALAGARQSEHAALARADHARTEHRNAYELLDSTNEHLSEVAKEVEAAKLLLKLSEQSNRLLFVYGGIITVASLFLVVA